MHMFERKPLPDRLKDAGCPGEYTYSAAEIFWDMDAPDALTALKDASLPSDMIGPIADALALLAPHTYSPAH
ncbi:hypothetical protein ACIQGT_26040 [Streptomyces sp. NPDC093108]|uniref:hypothetical protein n=1 Tax=Streptomyces sp. NPDC093108 TaxID=3366030 RepID=UPI0038101A97